MIIQVKGIAFQIVGDMRQSGIAVKTSADQHATVYVHPSTPHEELIAYLEAYNYKSPQDPTTRTGIYLCEISVFGQNYAVFSEAHIRKPYISGQSVRVERLSAKAVPRLKRELLHQFILQEIAAWEERLEFLLEEVIIRKLRKNPFVVHPHSKAIVFADRIADQPRPVISYLVAQSVFEFISLSPAQRDQLLVQYVPDWKHSARICNFEYNLD